MLRTKYNKKMIITKYNQPKIREKEMQNKLTYKLIILVLFASSN